MPVVGPGVGFHPYVMVFTVDLPNFPEWAIPFVKLIPKVYFEDGHTFDEIGTGNVTTYFKSVWHLIGENHWQIRVETQILARLDYEYIPVYLDVDLVILNERVWEEMNSNKV
jgi:hypothetical protein